MKAIKSNKYRQIISSDNHHIITHYDSMTGSDRVLFHKGYKFDIKTRAYYLIDESIIDKIKNKEDLIIKKRR